jgi:hypothetical protein
MKSAVGLIMAMERKQQKSAAPPLFMRQRKSKRKLSFQKQEFMKRLSMPFFMRIEELALICLMLSYFMLQEEQ